MRVDPGRPRRRRIALTSLIDVIFILLLFFLLTSTFSRFGEIRLATARETAGPVSDSPPVFVRLGPDDLTINGASSTLSDLAPALRVVAPTDGTDLLILVAVAPEVSSQRLVDLLMLLRPLNWANVSVLG